MTIIWHFPKELTRKLPPAYVRSHTAKKVFSWVIDSQYRKAVRLEEWLADESTWNLTSHPRTAQALKTIKPEMTSDERMLALLKWVRANITYTSDFSAWKMADKWQEPDLTLTSRHGDCEDGAVLLYCLARLAGVPKERLLIWCGDVQDPADAFKTVGHACLMYVPEEYPLNVAFMDWCYYYSPEPIGRRFLYATVGNRISGGSVIGGKVDPRYVRTWFAFNEEASHKDLTFQLKLNGFEQVKTSG